MAVLNLKYGMMRFSVFVLMLATLTFCGACRGTDSGNDIHKEENTAETQTENEVLSEKQDDLQGNQTTDDKQGDVESGDVEYFVSIETEYGAMKARLYNSTPKHRDNFLKLVDQGYYNGLLFHRIIPNFVVQGGDPDSKNAPPEKILGEGGPGYTIPAEIRRGLIHKKGALAAARLGDELNPRRVSSGSQFYMVQGFVWTDDQLDEFEETYKVSLTKKQRETYKTIGGLPMLDDGYTVFGEIVEGFDVLEALSNVEGNSVNRPLEDIHMVIRRVEE